MAARIASWAESQRLATALVRALAVAGPGATLVEIKAGSEDGFVIRYHLEGILTADQFELIHRYLAEGQS